MSDYVLEAVSPLGGYARSFNDVALTEQSDLAIVSIALPLGGDAAAEKEIKRSYGVALPPIGRSELSADGKTRLVRLGRDQLIALFSHTAPDAEAVVRAGLKGSAYTTDQTDVWVRLTLKGPGARRALERICPLDLDPEVFATGTASRTVMEHLGTLIIRTGDDEFLLLSGSSSAKSFLHAIEVSIKNTN